MPPGDNNESRLLSGYAAVGAGGRSGQRDGPDGQGPGAVPDPCVATMLTALRGIRGALAGHPRGTGGASWQGDWHLRDAAHLGSGLPAT